MSAKHTAPVGIEPQEYGVVLSNEGGSIGAAYPEDMSGRKHDALANARLWAAAPDLLDALRTCLAVYVDLAESGDAGWWDVGKEDHVIAARAAIAKAEGRE